MKNPKLASRFAAALYDFATETNHVEPVYKDVLLVQQVITENQELKTVLESPIIPEDKKQKVFRKIFIQHISETALRFFALILKKRREPQLLMICKQFVKLYYSNHNIKEAYITTAQPISEKMKLYIKNYIEQDSPYTLILHFSVDEKLIGGIIIKIDDLYFDASIQTKINKLKAEFSQNTYAIGF
ncbi:MAG: ATP synthase F1 subunit delta [Bacteroidetes bacterium]|nr:ATP synthase F1 subunit delta [Bacteroidota bacterium]MCL1969048.1 ATP synthase F1 subunit delta [Bacteroidota bacterium]